MILHRLLKSIIKKQRNHEFYYVNNIPRTDDNCIYAVNHSCKWDFQYMVEIAPKPFYILAGKQRLNFIDRVGFYWNGTVWVDRQNKKSKKKAKEKLTALLQKKKSICIFPEGTWNLSPSKPMLPLYWGVVDLAKKNHVPIIPICLEYRGDICYIKSSEPMYVDKSGDNNFYILKLTDIFATMKWELWEMFPKEKRSNIEYDYWDKYVKERLLEYEKLDYEYEKKCIRS